MNADAIETDLMHRRSTRMIAWDVPAVVGLVGVAGQPGLGLFGRSCTAACWSMSFAGPAVGHLINTRRTRRRRSTFCAPTFAVIAVLMAFVVVDVEPVPLDAVWVAAFVVWAFWHVHDRLRPEHRYRQTRPTPSIQPTSDFVRTPTSEPPTQRNNP